MQLIFSGIGTGTGTGTGTGIGIGIGANGSIEITHAGGTCLVFIVHAITGGVGVGVLITERARMDGGRKGKG